MARVRHFGHSVHLYDSCLCYRPVLVESQPLEQIFIDSSLHFHQTFACLGLHHISVKFVSELIKLIVVSLIVGRFYWFPRQHGLRLASIDVTLGQIALLKAIEQLDPCLIFLLASYNDQSIILK